MILLIVLLAKSVLLMACVVGILWALRKASPVLRHLVIVLSFLALIGMPLLTFQLREIKVESPGPFVRYEHYFVTPLATTTAPTPKIIEPMSSASGLPTTPETQKASEPADPYLILADIWALGFLFLLGRTCVQMKRAIAVLKSGHSIGGEWITLLPPHTRVIATSAVTVPLTLGFVRPTVLLPEHAMEWPESRFRAVLMHEGAHIKRADWVWLIAARIVGAAYWPNPLVWWALEKMRQESELAADQVVILAGQDPVTYAETLVELAVDARNGAGCVVLPFVDAASLKRRVAAILEKSQRLKPPTRIALACATALALFIVIPYSALKLVRSAARITTGVIDLDGIDSAEIVAITSMDGRSAYSWDLHGAPLARPLALSKSDLTMLSSSKPLPAGSMVRYVFYRLPREYNQPLTFQSLSGESIQDSVYTGMQGANVGLFTDSEGRNYHVLKLVVPKSSLSASIRVRYGTGNWHLGAYQDYRSGMDWQTVNSSGGKIQIAPMPKNLGDGSMATFTLADQSSDQETMVSFCGRAEKGKPFDPEVSYFEAMDGRTVAYSSYPPDKLGIVETNSRPLTTALLVDLPMGPKSTVPSTEPSGLRQTHSYEARNGIARLPDGSSIRINRLSNLSTHGKPAWGWDGTPVGKEAISFGPSTSEDPSPTPSSDQQLQLVLQYDANPNFLYREIFDDQGNPLLTTVGTSIVVGAVDSGNQGIQSKAVRGKSFSVFNGFVEKSIAKTGMFLKVADGSFGNQKNIERDKSFTFSAKKDWLGDLSVVLPPDIARFTDEDYVEFKPLDDKGREVKGPTSGVTSSFGQGLVEFNLTKAEADRVAAVEVKYWHYLWVHFPNVPFVPKAH